jgi:hypothetical protein
MLRKRKIEGEFVTLYRELIDDEMKFYKYFRVSTQQFTILLQNTVQSHKRGYNVQQGCDAKTETCCLSRVGYGLHFV